MNKKVNNFLEERLKRGYIQYTPEIASYWDAIIDWDKRKAGEGDFFITHLKKIKAKKILDMSCGTGYDSVRLLEKKYKVKSCDGNLFMLTKSRINAENYKVNLKAKFCDWERLRRAYKEKFDAVICLGDAFCHIFEKEKRLDILKQIYSLLRKGGIFIVDQRNFDKILRGDYSSKHKYVYCGIQLDTKFKKKTRDHLIIIHKLGGLKFEFNVYPIRFKEMRELLSRAGFKVSTFGDFSKRFKFSKPDFFQHICIKK